MKMPPVLDWPPRRPARAAAAALCVLLAAGVALAGCKKGGAGEPRGREAAPERDGGCVDPAKPKAYFYPAPNRTDYWPDDPWKDGCALLVPDHLFCCPKERASGASR